ncbi:MAG: hypothetical protein RBG13Loki_2687 [Promethearchaeota archaeon CR_4]|nr:MAG: hypothetical protein RBG13Loki_2687 [Candidatus Lokiarchaeota archaeon CR_4]
MLDIYPYSFFSEFLVQKKSTLPSRDDRRAGDSLVKINKPI